MSEAKTMSELELMIALRLRDVEFEHRYGMSSVDAATAAKAAHDVVMEFLRDRLAARPAPTPEDEG